MLNFNLKLFPQPPTYAVQQLKVADVLLLVCVFQLLLFRLAPTAGAVGRPPPPRGRAAGGNPEVSP